MKNIKKIFSDEGASSIVVSSPSAMRELGEGIAQQLEAGDVLGLVGDLGAGKTHLVQGILAGLGAQDAGASPTFSLVHEHNDTRLPVAHFDFYRMNSASEALGIGWEEYLDSGSVLLIEWADRFDGQLLPDDAIWLVLKHRGEGEREVMCPFLVNSGSL